MEVMRDQFPNRIIAIVHTTPGQEKPQMRLKVIGHVLMNVVS